MQAEDARPSALTIDAGLLKRYDRPGPRYTSYPTAVEFREGFSHAEYAPLLEGVAPADELSLYVHLPFCEHRCTFCGCHVVATRHRDVAAEYLDYLEREIDLVCQHLPGRPAVSQFHLGGGTPTYYSPGQLQRVHDYIAERFELLADAERAIEVDPRVTTHEHIDALAEMGFNRLSMGVQDFDADVQEAIGRGQDAQSTQQLFVYCRRRGFDSINLDLIYGLPHQTVASFMATIEAVLTLKPDRVALYSYAHVPWVRGNQKSMDTAALPSQDAKLELFGIARGAFIESGYEQIGMDHFALKDDEMSHARRGHTLHRNFMGYTVKRSATQLGFGISAIGEVGGAFAQNAKKLSTYYRVLDSGKLPVEKGYELSADDSARREVILSLMCNLYVDFALIESAFDLSFRDYFSLELEELRGGPTGDKLVVVNDESIAVTALGQLFLRNICMTFDRYLREKPPATPTYSRTV